MLLCYIVNLSQTLPQYCGTLWSVVKFEDSIKININLTLHEIAKFLHSHDEYLKTPASDSSTVNGIEWQTLNFSSTPPASK